MAPHKELHIPNTWSAFLLWITGRFGAGAFIGVVFGSFAYVVYGDMRKDREQMFGAIKHNTELLEQVLHRIENLDDRVVGIRSGSKQ